MNPDENTNLERAKVALETLRQKVEAVMKVAPNLMEISSLDALPQEKAKIVENQLWSIFVYGEYYVVKIMSTLSAPMLFVKNKGNFDYYTKTYKAVRDRIYDGLIDVVGAPTRREVEMFIMGDIFTNPMPLDTDINRHMDEYEEYANSAELQNYIKGNLILISDRKTRLKESFEKIYEVAGRFYWDISLAGHARKIEENYKEPIKKLVGDELVDDTKEYEHKWISNLELELSDCYKIMSMNYFNPDEWVENEKALSAVVVTREIEKIPMRIRERVEEIYNSFVFGNWMAVIALSRCLLEYAIDERKSRLKIEVYLDKDKTRTRPLAELISEVEKIFPELDDSMRTINRAGNMVMHLPIKKVSNLPPGKKEAKDCVDGIVKIISTLYSE